MQTNTNPKVQVTTVFHDRTFKGVMIGVGVEGPADDIQWEMVEVDVTDLQMSAGEHFDAFLSNVRSQGCSPRDIEFWKANIDRLDKSVVEQV